MLGTDGGAVAFTHNVDGRGTAEEVPRYGHSRTKEVTDRIFTLVPVGIWAPILGNSRSGESQIFDAETAGAKVPVGRRDQSHVDPDWLLAAHGAKFPAAAGDKGLADSIAGWLAGQPNIGKEGWGVQSEETFITTPGKPTVISAER